MSCFFSRLVYPGIPLPSTTVAFSDGAREYLQVLYNVLSNACKFTEKGSIWVDAKIIGDKVLVSVHDTGVGIPADKLPSIFGDYEQLDMSTTRR